MYNSQYKKKLERRGYRSVSMKTPFMTKYKTDLFRGTAYWIISLSLWLHVLLMLGWGVITLFVDIPHSLFISPPGLYTERYRSVIWVAMMLCALRVFYAVAYAVWLIFRRSACCGIAWMTIVGMLSFFCAGGTIFLWFVVGNANSPGDPLNVCNDALFFCVYYGHVLSPRNSPCVPAVPASSLTTAPLCVIALTYSLVQLAIELCLFLYPLLTWMFPPDITRPPKSKTEDPNERPDELPVTVIGLRNATHSNVSTRY